MESGDWRMESGDLIPNFPISNFPSGTDGVQELHLVELLVVPIRARDTLCALC